MSGDSRGEPRGDPPVACSPVSGQPPSLPWCHRRRARRRPSLLCRRRSLRAGVVRGGLTWLRRKTAWRRWMLRLASPRCLRFGDGLAAAVADELCLSPRGGSDAAGLPWSRSSRSPPIPASLGLLQVHPRAPARRGRQTRSWGVAGRADCCWAATSWRRRWAAGDQGCSPVVTAAQARVTSSALEVFVPQASPLVPSRRSPFRPFFPSRAGQEDVLRGAPSAVLPRSDSAIPGETLAPPASAGVRTGVGRQLLTGPGAADGPAVFLGPGGPAGGPFPSGPRVPELGEPAEGAQSFGPRLGLAGPGCLLGHQSIQWVGSTSHSLHSSLPQPPTFPPCLAPTPSWWPCRVRWMTVSPSPSVGSTTAKVASGAVPRRSAVGRLTCGSPC